MIFGELYFLRIKNEGILENSNSKKESDIKKEPASKNNRDNNSFFKCQNPGEATQSIDEPEKSLDNYPGFPGWDLGSF